MVSSCRGPKLARRCPHSVGGKMSTGDPNDLRAIWIALSVSVIGAATLAAAVVYVAL